MSNTIRSASTTCFAIVLSIALTSAVLTAQQGPSTSALRTSVMRLVSQGQFDAADRTMEVSLASVHPDYDVFWEYLAYLVNQAHPYQNVRAAQLGQKWLAVVRKGPPPVRGRIMKETAIGILFGPFKQTQSPANRMAARKLLEDAVESNPQLCEAYLHLSLIAALEGRINAALPLLDRAVEFAEDEEQHAKVSSIRDQSRKDPAYLVYVARRLYGIGQ